MSYRFSYRKICHQAASFLQLALFLWGLLSNDMEQIFGKLNDPRLCSVLFSLPFGLPIIMPRLSEMTCEEYQEYDMEAYICGQGLLDLQTGQTIPDMSFIPAEPKASSFGWTDDGRLLAIDYGGPFWYSETAHEIHVYWNGTGYVIHKDENQHEQQKSA